MSEQTPGREVRRRFDLGGIVLTCELQFGSSFLIGFARFDSEAFRRRLTEYSDRELIKLGKECAPGNRLVADPMTKAENVEKYKLCRAEWRRRHPRKTDDGDA